MELKKLVGHPARTAIITLLANTPVPRVLQHKDKYSKPEEAPISYQPRTNEHGAVIYEVPLPYATRLLSGEPSKYQLLAPEVLFVNMEQRNGGHALVEIKASTPIMVDGVVARRSDGLPVYAVQESVEAEPEPSKAPTPMPSSAPEPKRQRLATNVKALIGE
jgi:hypothetical protein